MSFQPPETFRDLEKQGYLHYGEGYGFGRYVQDWIRPINWFETDPERFAKVRDYMDATHFVAFAESGGGCYWAWFLKSPIGTEYEVCEVDVGMLTPYASTFELFIFRTYLDTLRVAAAEDFASSERRENELQILQETLTDEDYRFIRSCEQRKVLEEGGFITKAEYDSIIAERFQPRQATGFYGDYLKTLQGGLSAQGNPGHDEKNESTA